MKTNTANGDAGAAIHRYTTKEHTQHPSHARKDHMEIINNLIQYEPQQFVLSP